VSGNTFFVTVLQHFNTLDRSDCWGAWERKDMMVPFQQRLQTTCLIRLYGLTHQLTSLYSLQPLIFHSWTYSFLQSSLRPVAASWNFSKRELKLTCFVISVKKKLGRRANTEYFQWAVIVLSYLNLKYKCGNGGPEIVWSKTS